MKNVDREQVIQIILAEYTDLKSEIRSRSGIQNTILQFHITAITAILGGALSLPYGKWLIFLIPIEAALFGLWWIDHSLVITEIGSYIRTSIEPRIATIFKQVPILCWEAEFKKGIVDSSIKRDITFYRLVFITFAVPAIISLVYTSILILVTLQLRFKIFRVSMPSEITSVYPGMWVWLALSCFVINSMFFFIYMSMFFYRIHINTKTSYSNEDNSIVQ